MKTVLSIHLNAKDEECTVHFLNQEVRVIRRGSNGEPDRVQALMEEFEGQVDAIALQGMPATLRLGPAEVEHHDGARLKALSDQVNVPVLDGSIIRAGLERWGIILADRAQPGIFSHKRALMVPGLNHTGLSQALARHAASLTFGDPFVYFGMPSIPGVGSDATLNPVANAQLERLKDAPFRRIYPQPGEASDERAAAPFEKAHILAGDIGPIRRYAPDKLKGKTVIVNWAREDDIADLQRRGASILITLMPSLDRDTNLGQWPASTIEALLTVLREDPDTALSEDTFLNMLADVRWTPEIRYLQEEDVNINRFAFVIHPLNLGFIHKHPIFKWTRFLPDKLVEECAAYMPPFYISTIRGGVSPETGQAIEGDLISLGATPRMMMKHDERFTYKRLNRAAQMAEKRGARIMGLGAFTSVVGDAGVTVAHEADIAITSGNSLTVAATLEAAKMAVKMMGSEDLSKGKVMVVGATGSIASVCSRLLAQALGNIVLVSIEPEKLIDLKHTILKETPGAQVTIATKTGGLVADCDLIVTATSAFGQRVIDLTQCKPGAVICDVARPMDISPAEAALRPDLLVIESGEVVIPGEHLDIGYNIGLPPKTVYACLGETALLAMDGRFEDYTLGRNLNMDRVKDIWRMFKKHNFQIAGLRSFGDYITEENLAEKRKLADELRNDPELLERTKREMGEKLKTIPVMAKGVSAKGTGWRWWALDAAVKFFATLTKGQQKGK